MLSNGYKGIQFALYSIKIQAFCKINFVLTWGIINVHTYLSISLILKSCAALCDLLYDLEIPRASTFKVNYSMSFGIHQSIPCTNILKTVLINNIQRE